MSPEQHTTRHHRQYALTALAVALGYLILSNGFLFVAGGAQLAVVLGAIAAIMCADVRPAVVISAVVPAAMELASPPLLLFDQGISIGLLIETVVLAAATAYAIQWSRRRWAVRERGIVRAVSASIVALLVVNLWVPLLVAGIHPLAGYGALPASVIRPVPVAGQYITDDELYRRFFYLLHNGSGHYEAFRDAWLGLRIRGELPASVSSYRLPTFYWLWRLLPADAFLIEVVFLAFASVGGVAAACIAGLMSGVAMAPLAGAAVMVYAMGIGMSVYMTYVDFPAACLVLVGVALWLYARRRQSLRLLFAAAGAMTAAALMRELLAYMIVIALASVLLEPVAKRRRLALPWLSALGVFAIGYAAHAWNVITRIPDRTGHLNYWQGSPWFAFKSFTLFGDRFSGSNALLAVLFVAGVASAWFSGRRRSLAFAAFALTAVTAPLVGMLFVGNPGLDVHGGSVNYWGMLFVPLALSLWPILLRPEAPPVRPSPVLTTSREHRIPKSITAKPKRKKRRRQPG